VVANSDLGANPPKVVIAHHAAKTPIHPARKSLGKNRPKVAENSDLGAKTPKVAENSDLGANPPIHRGRKSLGEKKERTTLNVPEKTVHPSQSAKSANPRRTNRPDVVAYCILFDPTNDVPFCKSLDLL
jgi:hypothetical protein